jgi:hypothetical protein
MAQGTRGWHESSGCLPNDPLGRASPKDDPCLPVFSMESSVLVNIGLARLKIRRDAGHYSHGGQFSSPVPMNRRCDVSRVVTLKQLSNTLRFDDDEA